MLRKRAFAGISVLVLVLSVLLAPTVQAAGASGAGPGSFWSPIQTWVQELLADWFGWGTQVENSGPVSTYDASETTTQDPPSPAFGPTLPVPGDVSTTDEGGAGDPNG
jgi:hypothetical protein